MSKNQIIWWIEPKSSDMTNWTILSIAVHVLGWAYLMVHPPFVGMSSCPCYYLVLVFLLLWWSSHSVQWVYKGSLFMWVGVLYVREEDAGSSILLTWKGTYPLQPPLGLAKLWPSSMSSCVGHEVHHLMASTGKDIIPSAKCTCSFQYLCLLHITWCLHPSSVDALADIHGRSHNFLLIHPREVLLTKHWVTTWPLLSCGDTTSSLPSEVGLCGVGLVHLSHAWWTPVHKGMPTSDMMRRRQFGWRMCEHLHWSVTS